MTADTDTAHDQKEDAAFSGRRAPPGVSFGDAFRFWLKLGFISFGGPAGQISIMHQELVEKRHWISEQRFLHALNYCMVLPGPEAQQLATYIGWLMHRTWGGIVAGVLFVLPSLVILIALSWIYVAYGDVPWIAGVFYGIKPAVAAIVLHAAYRIGSRVLKNAVLWAVAATSLVALFAFNAPFPAVIACAALIGYVGGRLAPGMFSINEARGLHSTSFGASIIDDDTPRPDHARFSWIRLGALALIGSALWVIPMSLLVVLCGWDHTLTQMSWFFTKAALLTFGGAYAVLPYVYQGAVGDYGWLTAAQMIDGLALGETTPGPLIMVVAFVGFVGAYSEAVFGVDRLFVAGAVAAGLVTWFTFLPSFLFILGGGPLVESTRKNPNLSAPLTSITAAVVGGIMSLTLFFGYHVLWPGGLGHAFDWIAAVIAIGAAIALFRLKASVLQVIGACALIGLLLRLVQ